MVPSPSDKRELGRMMAIGQVGLEMVAPIVLGLFLDNRVGTRPWGVVLGAIFGLVGGLTHLVFISQRLEKDSTTPPNQNAGQGSD